MASPLRVLDVQEREAGAPQPPSFPTAQTSASGFPQPKKRSRFSSKLKQQRETAAAPAAQATTTNQSSFVNTSDDRVRIDRENRERLRDMGASEIAEAREELLSNLDPALLQILLRRANLDEGNESLPTEHDQTPKPAPVSPIPPIRIGPVSQTPHQKNAALEETRTLPKKSVSFAEPESKDRDVSTKDNDAILEDAHSQADLFPISTPEAAIASTGAAEHDHHVHSDSSTSMHFPHKPSVPDLDPADPNFLENLHSKYFPNLPADPARLAWMAPIPTADSVADRESPYYPGQATVAVAQLRFDFRGQLIPPRVSRDIPVSKGLHHHGEAPEAAGYTVGELARLARSAVPAQRCVAFQTLGRILFRLGRGEWGESAADIDKDPRSAVAQGIWRSVKEGRVMDTLREAAGVEEGRGHQGSRAYAIEAVWLFEKGGWKETWKGR
ncbi:transcription factor [Grosmannia clavigera kw1407]|uniref:Transcription factor n=1 Tax=Grosmannia clavigera (strain kw1407 / UAMH 11150) TaxID=655863 RepID=F0XG19_GROCL|nr:transcription factor [Grosmannia clavigera kw1407]EFX03416.1 transcription factor [Grosmannia clavigera kw1407]